MNKSHLAPRANPGGALPTGNPARLKALGIISRFPTGALWIQLRKLILIGTCLLPVAQGIASSSVTLAWDANTEPEVAGYELRYGESSGNYTSSVQAGKTTTTSVSGLTEGKTYYFAVFAYNSSGVKSAPSNEAVHSVVSAINVAPSAIAKSLTTAEDTSVSIVLAGSDPEGSPLTYSVVSGPTKGTLSGTPPNLTYSPVADFNGSDSLTFRANDGSLDSELATISITVTPANDAPSAIAKSVTTAEETPVLIALVGFDKDADVLSFSVDADPTNGTLSGTGSNLTYRPAANFHGSDSFTFRVHDGTVFSAPATVSIYIEAVNKVPVAIAKSITTAENVPISMILTGSDVEGSPLTHSVVTGPTKGIISGTPPNLTYTPAANFHGSDSFTFRVHDGTVFSGPATVSINITAVNKAPVAIAKSITTAEDTPISLVLAGSDEEGDPLTYSVVSSPTQGTLSGTPPNLIYSPAADFNGSDSLTFRVHDGTVFSAPATVSINITAVNDAPVAIARSYTTAEDSSVYIVLAGSDVEGSPLTCSVVSGPTKGKLSGTPPNLIYSPAADFNGNDSLTFRVNDGSLDSELATISITVTPVNDAPVAIAQSVTTAKDTPVLIALAVFDKDADVLSYSIDAAPTNGTLSSTGSNLTYRPAANFHGSDSFTFRVHDGTVFSAPATVSINVTAVNDAPVAIAESVATAEDTPVSIVLTGSDVEGSPLTFTVVSNPTRGKISGTPPNLTYSPIADFNGIDSLTFRVNDGSLDSELATISIMVTPVNDAPLAQAKSFITPQATPIAIVLSGSDPENSSLTCTVVAGPAKGSLSGVAPDLTYSPAADFSGEDSFTFLVNDGSADSGTATISITVTPVDQVVTNVPPVFAKPRFEVYGTEDKAFRGQLAATDDNPGDTLSFAKVSGPDWLVVSPSGSLGGTPLNEDVGPNDFVISVTDSANASTTAILVVRVGNTNDAPAFIRSSFTHPNGAEQIPYTGQTLAGSANDPDKNDILTYSKISGPKWLLISKTGELEGTPPLGSKGLNRFTIRVTDAAGASSRADLQIQIAQNSLPLPWTANTIGVATPEAQAAYSGGNYTLAGAGSLTTTKDSGTFGYQTLTADGQITAQVAKLDDTGTAASVGLTIRESLAPNSRLVSIGVNGKGTPHQVRRTTTGGAAGKITAKSARAPQYAAASPSRAAAKHAKSKKIWLRLVRKGNTVTSYTSSNGKKWKKVGATTVKLPKNCYIGLSVSSGKSNKLNISTFSNVRVNP